MRNYEKERQARAAHIRARGDSPNLSSTSIRNLSRDMAVEPPGAEVIYTAAQIAAHWTRNNPNVDPSRVARAATKAVQDARNDGTFYNLYRYWRFVEQERIDLGIGIGKSAPAQEVTPDEE